MTPQRYEKIRALAEDVRTDPATRVVAQKLVNKWKAKMEGQPKKSLHPGMRQSSEYRKWVKSLHIGSRREPRG